MSGATKVAQLSPGSSNTPPKSMTSAELDELEEDFESDVDDPTVFKIRKPIQPATALLLTTKDLHGVFELSTQFNWLFDLEE
jgi:hypothetical protein